MKKSSLGAILITVLFAFTGCSESINDKFDGIYLQTKSDNYLELKRDNDVLYNSKVKIRVNNGNFGYGYGCDYVKNNDGEKSIIVNNIESSDLKYFIIKGEGSVTTLNAVKYTYHDDRDPSLGAYYCNEGKYVIFKTKDENNVKIYNPSEDLKKGVIYRLTTSGLGYYYLKINN